LTSACGLNDGDAQGGHTARGRLEDAGARMAKSQNPMRYDVEYHGKDWTLENPSIRKAPGLLQSLPGEPNRVFDTESGRWTSLRLRGMTIGLR